MSPSGWTTFLLLLNDCLSSSLASATLVSISFSAASFCLFKAARQAWTESFGCGGEWVGGGRECGPSFHRQKASDHAGRGLSGSWNSQRPQPRALVKVFGSPACCSARTPRCYLWEDMPHARETLQLRPWHMVQAQKDCNTRDGANIKRRRKLTFALCLQQTVKYLSF